MLATFYSYVILALYLLQEYREKNRDSKFSRSL